MNPSAESSAENSKQKMPSAIASQGISASVFEWNIRVYWEDTDAGGIVFYANYLKFFERARTEWLRSLGLGQQALKDQLGGMFVVTDAQIKYHRPARLDDVVCVTVRLSELGRAGAAITQQAWLQPAPVRTPGTSCTETPSGTGAVLLCDGVIRSSWVDAQRMRPVRMPDGVRSALLGCVPPAE